MARRPHLALAQALRPAPILLSRQALAVAAGLLAALSLAYLAARETPLFALSTVEVAGAPPAVREAVQEAVAPLVGESLVSLDGDALRRSLEELPSVRSLHYDRAFPHTLRIVVRPERPIAILRRRQGAWVVSDRGRVIGEADGRRKQRYPRIWLSGSGVVSPGEVVTDREVRISLRALTELPARFPARVRVVRAREGELALVLRNGTELRLGEPATVRLKLVVAARVLRSLSDAERADLAYLDLTVPSRPVGALKSQLSG